MNSPPVGLSLMLEPDYLQAALPLFEGGEVEVLEWSMDIGWSAQGVPDWAGELINFYSQNAALLGHGVTYSLLSAEDSPRQKVWLERLAAEVEQRSYRHISEHFGFLTAGNFHEGAPLPVPLTPAALEIGRTRLCALSQIAGVPIGLENLAFAFGPQDVHSQGPFLEQLLEPVDGFLLVDLHNVYCQMHNFRVDVDYLLSRYPLHRVREMHISGGSWDDTDLAEGELIRRDTHDGAVPEEVFGLVQWALRRCPNVEAVIFERLGGTLNDETETRQFQDDFWRLKELVAGVRSA